MAHGRAAAAPAAPGEAAVEPPNVNIELGRPEEPSDLPAPAVAPPEADPTQRRMYVTKAMCEEFGFTPGCKGCESLVMNGVANRTHDEFCRNRIASCLERKQKGSSRPVGADAATASGSRPAGARSPANEANGERSDAAMEPSASSGDGAPPAGGAAPMETDEKAQEERQSAKGKKRPAQEELVQEETRPFEVADDDKQTIDAAMGVLYELGYDVHVSEIYTRRGSRRRRRSWASRSARPSTCSS
jgi:type IV secretory pathway VirB10-like protein